MKKRRANTNPDAFMGGADTSALTTGTDLVLANNTLSSPGGLAGYIRAVNAIPRLSASHERDLAIAYREHNNLDAARQLVLSQLSYVVYLATKFRGYGLPESDLIQEGNIGLMKAVKHFDPYRGVRFITFAAHWIRAEIYEFVIRNWRIVKIATTQAQRKLFFGLRKSRQRLGVMNRRELEKAAIDFDVKVADVALMDGRLNNADVSFEPLNEANDSFDDSNTMAPAEFIAADEADPATVIAEKEKMSTRREGLCVALSHLDERSTEIVRSRWLVSAGEKKSTLQDLAKRFNISVERVRQVEQAALNKVRKALQDSTH